jgi:hypothetical protein
MLVVNNKYDIITIKINIKRIEYFFMSISLIEVISRYLHREIQF